MMNNELRLCSCIYDFSVIEFSIRSYSQIAKIEVKKNDNYYVCKFTDCKYDLLQTMREFENFIIQASNSKELGL